MEKIYNKLVRDNIPDIIKADGEEPITHILNDEEYRIELMQKLGEELLEVRLASNNLERTEELADMLELIISLNKSMGNTWEDLEKIRNKKLARNGGFDKKIYLERVLKK